MDFFSPTRGPHRDHAHDTDAPIDNGDDGSDMSITLELPGLKHARSPARRMQEQSYAEPRPTQRRRLTLEQLGDNDNTDSSFRTANEEVLKNVDVLHEIMDDDSDMELTQPITTEQPTNTRQQENLDNDNDSDMELTMTQASTFANRVLPTNTRQQENLDNGDDSDMELTMPQASPFANRVFSGVPEGDRDLLSPIAARGIRSPQALYSPRRTFFLHGNKAPGSHPSPMRPIPTTTATTPAASPLRHRPPPTPTRDSPSITNRTHTSALPATPPRFTATTPTRFTAATPPRLRAATPKSSLTPRRYSASSRSSIYTRRTDDQSVNLDEMMDRVISMNEDQNMNIFDEEYSQLYSSINGSVIDEEEDKQSIGVQSMDLRTFLRHIGVLFDPLDPLEDMVRTTEPQSIQGPISPTRQGITAATSMKELETYKEYSIRLKELVQSGNTERMGKDTATKYNAIVAEYFDGDKDTKYSMERSLKDMWGLTRSEAHCTLLEWKESIYRQLLEETEELLQQVSEDERQLTQYEIFLQSKTSDVQSHNTTLKEQLADAKKRQGDHTYTEPDPFLMDDIHSKEMLLKETTAFKEQVTKEEEDIKQELDALETKMAQLNTDIANAMDKPELKKHATRHDLDEAKSDLEQRCKVCGWKLLDYSDEMITIAFTKDISMKMKRQQGQNEFDFSIGSDGQQRFGVFSHLILHGLHEIVKLDRWNVKRMMDKIGLFTKWAALMHQQIDNVGRRFWFKLEKIGDGSIKGSFEPVSMDARAKFSVTLWIQPSDVMNFPAINLDNVNIQKNYGSASQEQLEQKGRELLEEYGFIHFGDTLKEMLALLES